MGSNDDFLFVALAFPVLAIVSFADDLWILSTELMVVRIEQHNGVEEKWYILRRGLKKGSSRDCCFWRAQPPLPNELDSRNGSKD